MAGEQERGLGGLPLTSHVSQGGSLHISVLIRTMGTVIPALTGLLRASGPNTDIQSIWNVVGGQSTLSPTMLSSAYVGKEPSLPRFIPRFTPHPPTQKAV